MDIQAIGAASRATTSMMAPQMKIGHDGFGMNAMAAPEASGVSKFGALLSNMVGDASAAEATSDGLVEKMAKGEPVDIHRVMSAVTEADLSFRMVMEVRNKLVEAWQQISRMPV